MAAVAEVLWRTYIGTSGDDDAVKSAWVVPATDQNGYGDNGDLALLRYNGQLRGAFSNTLSDSSFDDKLVKTGNADIRQYQVSTDGTRLYVGGTTVRSGWAAGGFDTSLSSGTLTRFFPGTDRYDSDSRDWFSTFTEDGFLGQFDLRLSRTVVNNVSAELVRGTANYITYVGGSGEAAWAENPFDEDRRDFFQTGRDFANTFYVDPTQAGGQVLVAGVAKARVGITDRSDARIKPGTDTFIDGERDYGEFSQVPDGMLYSLRDSRHVAGVSLGPDPNEQLNWATYLSPTTPISNTDDGDSTFDYVWPGRIEEVDFVWSALSKDTGDRLIFMLANVRQGTAVDAPLSTMLVTMNQSQLENTSSESRLARLQNWVKFEPFQYDRTYVEKLVVNSAVRSDGDGRGPVLFLRYADMIRKIDLPRAGDVKFDLAQRGVLRVIPGTWGGWRREFEGEIAADAMAVAPSGDKVYVASTVEGYEWLGYPRPIIGTSNTNGTFSGGRGREGVSDAVIMELEMAAPQINWMMLQGGDDADRATGVAAFSDGTVWLMGTTSSKPTARNPDGWIPANGNRLDTIVGTAPVPAANGLGRSESYIGGTQDGFIVAIRTNNIVTSGEIEVAGVVGGGATVISDGSAIPAAANGTLLAKSWLGGPATEQTFRVTNRHATESLTLSSVQLPSWLTVKAGTALPSRLAAGASANVTFVVDNRLVGTFSGTVTLPSSDADESPYEFAVRAEVTAPPPTTFSVSAAPSVAEGNSGTRTVSFTVTMTPGTPAPVYPLSVNYATAAVTATAGTDFNAASGVLTFATGETSKTVSVTVRGDTTAEADETFKLVLSGPTQGAISAEAGEAVVAIINDDGQPQPLTVGFSPATLRVTEGSSGVRSAVMTVRLSQVMPTPVTVQYATSNGTATAGSDYIATSGQVTIPVGATQRSFSVPILGDTAAESDETFTVRLSNAPAGVTIAQSEAVVTIGNDDGVAALPQVRVSNASMTEGNTGIPRLTFTVMLTRPVPTPTVLTVTTVDGTARANRDYRPLTQTVTIPANRTSAAVQVQLIPNRIADGNRTFTLQVRSGTMLVASAVGTIVDDDRPSTTSLALAFASLDAASTTKRS